MMFGALHLTSGKGSTLLDLYLYGPEKKVSLLPCRDQKFIPK